MESIAAKGIGEKALIRVESASRQGFYHYVDMEREVCSCESRVICWHIRSQWCPVCSGLGTYISYPRLMTCLSCDGTGRAA